MRVLNTVRNVLIIISSTVIGFCWGGGYRLQNVPVEELFVVHHHQGEDESTDIYAYIMRFILFGGAGAVAGAGLSVVTLYVLTKLKKI